MQKIPRSLDPRPEAEKYAGGRPLADVAREAGHDFVYVDDRISGGFGIVLQHGGFTPEAFREHSHVNSARFLAKKWTDLT